MWAESPRFSWQVLILIIVALILAGGLVLFSIRSLPAPPIGPTPTYPKAIDFPDGRPVPAR